MIKAIIFDLDGTLAYTAGDLRIGMNEMLTEKGYPTRTPEQILMAINYGAREFVRRSLPEDIRDIPEILDDCFECYSGHYTKHCLDTTYIYDGMTQVLERERVRGLRLAVLTNKGDEHAKFMMNKLLPDAFDRVMGNGIGFPPKPDPASALALASELGAMPNEVLYVGDSEVDMKTARNAGFYACGVTWGYGSCESLIRSGAYSLVDKPADISVLTTL